eukprot:5070912-Pleurochrysis_carterae.AAC.1
MDLAQLRYVKLVPAAHVDIVKGCISDRLIMAADAIISDLTAELSNVDFGPNGASVVESLSTPVQSKLGLCNGLRTDHQEYKYLLKQVLMVQPTRRVMPPTATKRVPRNKKTGASAAVQHPPVPKSLVAYGFKLDELLARLVEHCESAREAIYETLLLCPGAPGLPHLPNRRASLPI